MQVQSMRSVYYLHGFLGLLLRSLDINNRGLLIRLRWITIYQVKYTYPPQTKDSLPNPAGIPTPNDGY